MEGRDVTLRIYTEAADVPQAEHAMASLKRAMKWDEDVFGALLFNGLSHCCVGYRQKSGP